MLSIISNFEVKAGYRAFVRGLSNGKMTTWSELLSQFQKSVRRQNVGDCVAAAGQIFLILRHRKPANWTNFINRVMITLSEDCRGTPEHIIAVGELVGQFKDMQERWVKSDSLPLSSDTENAQLLQLVVRIARTLASAPAQTRDASHAKAAMWGMQSEQKSNGVRKFVPAKVFEDSEKIGFLKLLKKRNAPAALMAVASRVFGTSLYKDGNIRFLTGEGYKVIMSLWRDIFRCLGLSFNLSTAARKKPSFRFKITYVEAFSTSVEKKLIEAVKVFHRYWLFQTRHGEQYLWPIKAILLICNAGTKKTAEIGWKAPPERTYTLPLEFKLADYARDMHTGAKGLRKDNAEGIEMFLSEGMKVKNEDPELPPYFKELYIHFKKLDIERFENKEKGQRKKAKVRLEFPEYPRVGPSKKKLEFINRSRIVWAGRCQLPCGTKPGTWIARTEDGRCWWVKEVHGSASSVTVQVEFDKIKKLFRVIPLGVTYHPDGYLFAPDMGTGAPYKLVPHKKRTDVKIVSDTGLQVISRMKGPLPDGLMGDIMLAFALRGICRISDSTLVNAFVDAKGRGVSCDEATVIPEQKVTDIWSFVMPRVPRKELLDQFKCWLRKNSAAYKKTLESWLSIVNGQITGFIAADKRNILRRLNALIALVPKNVSRKRTAPSQEEPTAHAKRVCIDLTQQQEDYADMPALEADV